MGEDNCNGGAKRIQRVLCGLACAFWKLLSYSESEQKIFYCVVRSNSYSYTYADNEAEQYNQHNYGSEAVVS